MSRPALELGIHPRSLVVHLTTGADFSGVLRSRNKTTGELEDWPEGTEWSLVFADGTVWDADVDGPLATWDEDKAVADLRSAGQAVKLRYVNGTTDRIYYTGTVARHG